MKKLRLSNIVGASFALLFFSALNSQHSTAFAQGSLNPPGPPAPTMKTLVQIEPRTPISSLPYTISNSGSYYLTANLTGVAGANGITISVGNVNVDFAGFTLTGIPGSLSGVSVSNPQFNLSIYNGNVCNWGGYGINATNVSNVQLEQLRASSNSAGGLAVGSASLIGHCSAMGNLGTGIASGAGAAMEDCVSTFNQGWGISAGDNGALRYCTTIGNINTPSPGGGIIVGNGCTLIGCTASSNNANGGSAGITTGSDCNILSCTANYNWPNPYGSDGDYGIAAGSSCHIKDCTANGNAAGIGAGTNSYVQDCIACNNLGGGSGFGIVVGDFSSVRDCVAQGSHYEGIGVGNYCSVFDNTCTDNHGDGGGQVDLSSHDTAVHNFVVTNGLPAFFYFGSNNAVGTVESYSSMNTNKNPHANFNP